MIRVGIYGAVLVVGVVAWIVRQIQSRRTQFNPLAFQPRLGPIVRTFRVAVSNGPQLVAQAAAQAPGMSVAQIIGDVVFVNSRPSVGRIDDGMGMFLRVISSSDENGWHLRFEGQPKSNIGATSEAQRGFAAVERDIRAVLGRMGFRSDDGLDSEVRPLSDAAMLQGPLAPAAVARPSAAMRVEINGQRLEVASLLAVGRAPVSPAVPGACVLAVNDALASKTHAYIGWDGHQSWIEDRGSTNGTSIESGSSIRALPSMARQPLSANDIVVIGEHRLTIRIENRG